MSRRRQILLFHAAAVVAAAGALHQDLRFRPLAVAATIGRVIGAALFSGDIAMRALAGHRPFPMAAPAGWFILIASWVAFCAAGVIHVERVPAQSSNESNMERSSEPAG